MPAFAGFWARYVSVAQYTTTTKTEAIGIQATMYARARAHVVVFCVFHRCSRVFPMAKNGFSFFLNVL